MINRFMLSVAGVALIAGAGFANAQGTMGKEGPSAGASTEHSAPAGAKGQRAEDNQKSNSMRSETKQPIGGKEQAQGREDKDTHAQGREDKDMRAQGREDKGTHAQGREDKDMRAQGREDKDTHAQGREDKERAQGREDRGNMNAAESKRPEEGRTTGQAGAGAKLSGEQRTRITTVIREQHVAPLDHVNFSISVGTRVPRDVSFHPLPTEIVSIYPEWRGYEFILVHEQIVVVDPRTFEIVAVLDA